METKGKKRLLNIIMVLLILVIAVSGVVTVGKVQGWFDSEEEAVFVSGKVKGVVNIERKGIGYTLKKDIIIENGDVVETKKGAEAELLLEDTGVVAENGNTEIKFTSCEKEKAGIEVLKGEIFGDAVNYDGNLELCFGGNTSMLSGAAFSVSVQSGSSTLQVYDGDISVTLADGTVERVERGEYLSCVSGEGGKVTCSVEQLQAESMNEFLIRQAQECDSAEKLCFSKEQLQKVLDDRAAEKQAAIEASLKAKDKVRAEKKETGDDSISSGDEKKNTENDISRENQSTVEEYISDGENYSNEAANSNDNFDTDYSENSNTNSGAESNMDSGSGTKTCTIEIRCDTILNNMENLDNGKEVYVPSNGTILATSPVEFQEGETVFDVLTRVCDYAGIQIEYSWTPMYNSYYIEGNNNLYEFDCGNESGWMYKVNGWFPNYGCSSYTLEDGDVIVWCYTCNGLGADVGGPVY